MAMDTSDLCKLRIEDAGRERDTLRKMEWETFFQSFVGYAAIAVAYGKLHPSTQHKWVLLTMAVVTTTLLALGTFFLLQGVHRRAAYSADVKYAYFDKLHELLEFENLYRKPTDFRPYWAAAWQHCFSIATAVALVIWESWMTC
jgi:hypothetical protein